MASRRCIIVADAWLTGFARGAKDHTALPDVDCYALARYLLALGYAVTQVEAMQIIKDYIRRGTLLV